MDLINKTVSFPSCSMERIIPWLTYFFIILRGLRLATTWSFLPTNSVRLDRIYDTMVLTIFTVTQRRRKRSDLSELLRTFLTSLTFSDTDFNLCQSHQIWFILFRLVQPLLAHSLLRFACVHLRLRKSSSSMSRRGKRLEFLLKRLSHSGKPESSWFLQQILLAIQVVL